MIHKLSLLKDLNYRSPSKIVTYLQIGWGHRDVRGPYINGDEAVIFIPNRDIELFNSVSIEICLGASNLLPTDAAVIKIEYRNDINSLIIRKNRESCIKLNIYPNYQDITIKIYPPKSNYFDRRDFIDVIALNNIRIFSDERG